MVKMFTVVGWRLKEISRQWILPGQISSWESFWNITMKDFPYPIYFKLTFYYKFTSKDCSETDHRVEELFHNFLIK